MEDAAGAATPANLLGLGRLVRQLETVRWAPDVLHKSTCIRSVAALVLPAGGG